MWSLRSSISIHRKSACTGSEGTQSFLCRFLVRRMLKTHLRFQWVFSQYLVWRRSIVSLALLCNGTATQVSGLKCEKPPSCKRYSPRYFRSWCIVTRINSCFVFGCLKGRYWGVIFLLHQAPSTFRDGNQHAPACPGTCQNVLGRVQIAHLLVQFTLPNGEWCQN